LPLTCESVKPKLKKAKILIYGYTNLGAKSGNVFSTIELYVSAFQRSQRSKAEAFWWDQ